MKIPISNYFIWNPRKYDNSHVTNISNSLLHSLSKFFAQDIINDSKYNVIYIYSLVQKILF